MSERQEAAHCPHCGQYGRPKPLIHEATQVYVSCDVHGLIGLRRDGAANDRPEEQ